MIVPSGDPAIDAARRARSRDRDCANDQMHAEAGAREALKPIREALDRCAQATMPPCDFATLFNEYEKVIDTISGLAFTAEEINAVT